MNTVTVAAECGNLDNIKWLQEKQYPWDTTTTGTTFKITAAA